MKRSCVSLMCLVLLTNVALAESWPQWRGPGFNGSSSETGLPDRLDPASNLIWKADLPGHSSGTAVVSESHVFTTAVDKESRKLLAICLDRADGKLVWKREVGDGFASNNRNDQAGPSPVTDGKTAWFYFGSGDLAAFDIDGTPKWSRNLTKEYGPFNINWIYSSSPLLYDGKLFVQVVHRDGATRRQQQGGAPGSGNAESYLLGIEPETGKNLFRVVRPDNARAESKESYATPIPHENGTLKEVIVVGADCVTGHNTSTGEELWRMGGWNPQFQGNWRVVPPPVVVGDKVVFCTPQGQSKTIAFDLGKTGDISASKAWENTDAKSDVPAPLFYQGSLYVLDGDWRKGITCLDPATGQTKWTSPVPSRAVFRASPTGADGKIYVMNEQAEVWVLSATDGKVISTSALATDGSARGSIAVSDGKLFVRTGNTLYCFGSK